MNTSQPLPVCLVSSSAPIAAVVRESLAIALPGATLEQVAPDAAMPRGCVVLIVDATQDAAGGAEVARRARAGGSQAAIVLLVAARDEALAARGAAVGALEQVALDSVPRELGPAIERASGGAAGSEWPGDLAALREELRKTQRLMAAGEIALGLQHAVNNPLTSVLAEAQLLELEEGLPAEMMASVKRIVESTRRVVVLVRKLDVLSTKKQS